MHQNSQALFQYFLGGLSRKVESFALTEERILALKQIAVLPHSASITEEEGDVLIEEEGEGEDPPNEPTSAISNRQPIQPDAIKHDKKIAGSFTYHGITLAIEDDSDSNDGMESCKYLISVDEEAIPQRPTTKFKSDITWFHTKIFYKQQLPKTSACHTKRCYEQAITHACFPSVGVRAYW